MTRVNQESSIYETWFLLSALSVSRGCKLLSTDPVIHGVRTERRSVNAVQSLLRPKQFCFCK